jgi:hypothetical protein
VSPAQLGIAQRTSSFVDYDVHGLVGIRLIDPSPADVAAVSAQIGLAQGTLSREPAITIRFVRDIPTTGVLRYVEPREVGFTDDAFLLLTRRSGGKPEAQIPLEAVGGVFGMVCRSGLGAVPLLRPLLDLTMLGKGVAAVHAAAFSYNGKGTMIAGWAGGAKTTTLLAFMANGADFIADDRVYLNPDGNLLFGLPEPISLRARHLNEVPQYRQLVDRRTRTRLRTLSLLGRLAGSIADRGGQSGARRFADRVVDFAEDANAAVPPNRLFERRRPGAELAAAFLSIPHEIDDLYVEPVDADWLADRLAFALRSERQRLLARYFAFRFAFPERTSELIEDANEIERELLSHVLRGTATYALFHPSPASPQALFEAVAPILTGTTRGLM